MARRWRGQRASKLATGVGLAKTSMNRGSPDGAGGTGFAASKRSARVLGVLSSDLRLAAPAKSWRELEAAMNDRFGNERNRRGQPGWQGQRPDENRAEPQYSSDWDETRGSEWQRGRGEGQGQGQRRGSGQGAAYGPTGGYGAGEGERGGWYSHGNAGMYGSGGGGGYTGGHGGSGYGGSTGTDYGAGNYGGGVHGGSGGEPGYGRERGFGGARDQGFRDRDISGPGTDLRGGGFAGRGPKDYTRSDDRIREDVCDRLSIDDDVDASEIQVRVENGEVTLVGTVQTRSMKHQAEDLAEAVPGVSDVHNQLRVLKGILTELKDKITGDESERHYANGGTRDKAPNGTLKGASNGRL